MQLVASYGYGRKKAKHILAPEPRVAAAVKRQELLRLLNDLDAYLAADFSLMAWASSSLTHIKIWDFSTVKT